jgi:hypothetical protein
VALDACRIGVDHTGEYANGAFVVTFVDELLSCRDAARVPLPCVGGFCGNESEQDDQGRKSFP